MTVVPKATTPSLTISIHLKFLRVRKSYHKRTIHTFNSFLLFSKDLEMTDSPGDEEVHPNLIYQCHESISESSDVINSTVGTAPPIPIMITRKRILEPESKDFDELVYFFYPTTSLKWRLNKKGFKRVMLRNKRKKF